MPTIDSLPIIKEMLRNNGFYPGDPQALAIHSYINDWSNKTYHIAYSEAELRSLWSSPACNDIKLLWSRHIGLTALGKDLLEDD